MLNVHEVVLPSRCCDGDFNDELAAAGQMWSIPYKQHKGEGLGTDF